MKSYKLLSLILSAGITSTLCNSPNAFADTQKIQNLTLTSNVTLGNITCIDDKAVMDNIQGSHVAWEKSNIGGTDQLSYELCEALLQGLMVYNETHPDGNPTVTFIYNGTRIVGYSGLSDATGLILEQ